MGMSISRHSVSLIAALFVSWLGCDSSTPIRAGHDGAAGAIIPGAGGALTDAGGASHGTGGLVAAGGALGSGGSTGNGGQAGGGAAGSGSGGKGSGDGGSMAGRTGNGGAGGAASAGGRIDSGVGTGGSGSGGRTGSGGAGGASVPDGGQDASVVCGNATCAAGEYCCNAACNLCAPVGYLCAQGCGSDASADVNASDGSRDLAVPDATRDLASPAVDGALAAFCTGDTPKAVINGVESSPTVTGGILALDCCDGGMFTIATPSFNYKVYVMWEAQVGSGGYPAVVDIAHPTKGWGVGVELSCAGGTSCYPSPDTYNTGDRKSVV